MKIKSRKPNISKTLIENSISALFCAIEIHNKPRIDYRYPNVVVILLNAWELALKSYLYKYKKNKQIVKKNKYIDSVWNIKEHYIWFDKCLSLAFEWKTENLVYISNIQLLADYRHMITHAFTKELDEIIYSIISENIILYSSFLRDYMLIDINKYDDNLVLLPIWFKKPFNPLDFLSNESFIKSCSIDVKEFIFSIISKAKKLEDEWISDGLLIWFNMEIVWKNKVKNADLKIKNDPNSEIGYTKETKIIISNEPWVQKIWYLTDNDIMNNFKIIYKEIPNLCKERYINFKFWNTLYKERYKEIKKDENMWIIWARLTKTWIYRYNEKIFSILDKYFILK